MLVRPCLECCHSSGHLKKDELMLEKNAKGGLLRVWSLFRILEEQLGVGGCRRNKDRTRMCLEQL